MPAHRYKGPTTVKQSYMKEFAVECPKCKKEALVTCDFPYFPSESGQLKCNNCLYKLKSKELIFYNAIVKRNCDECGKLIHITIPENKNKTENIKVPCPHCGSVRSYKPKFEIYQMSFASKGNAVDPVFHLPLWLQSNVKGNLFWAYNRAHLQEIKSYVSSKLRERQTTTHTTMVEKLPKFIKEAKNRDAVLKVIQKLEMKFYSQKQA